VKELGPGEIKPSDTSAATTTAGSSLVSAQKSDLTLLHNANVGSCHIVSCLTVVYTVYGDLLCNSNSINNRSYTTN